MNPKAFYSAFGEGLGAGVSVGEKLGFGIGGVTAKSRRRKKGKSAPWNRTRDFGDGGLGSTPLTYGDHSFFQCKTRDLREWRAWNKRGLAGVE